MADRGDFVGEARASMPVVWRYSLRNLMAVITFVSIAMAIAAFVFHTVAGPVIPRSRLRRIEAGMTQQQVIETLGEPKSRDDGEWDYERLGNSGWVEVHFDADGKVAHVNDESVFPNWPTPD